MTLPLENSVRSYCLLMTPYKNQTKATFRDTKKGLFRDGKYLLLIERGKPSCPITAKEIMTKFVILIAYTNLNRCSLCSSTC